VKILHIDTGKGWRGGQQQVFNLHLELTRAGVDSHLITQRGGELLRRSEGAGLPVYGLPLLGEWDLYSALKIAGRLKRGGFTHLHLHSSHAQGIGVLAAMLSGFRNVIATRRVDFEPKSGVLNRIKYGGRIKRFVAISEAIKAILLAFGVPEEKISLVNSGVDPDRIKPGSGNPFRGELGISEGALLIGNISALTDHKGQRYFIEAIPQILLKAPEARFVIVGSGELEEDLKAQAAGLGLNDALTFTGFRSDVDEIMDALDIFVMSSHMEGLGTIVMDALAASKPVVATQAGGIPEIIGEDRGAGLLVPPKDPAAIADAVLELIEDEGLAVSLAAAGRKRVVDKFSAKAMMEGNLALYRELGYG